MQTLLLTYDVHKDKVNHSNLKDWLISQGWSDTMPGENLLKQAVTCHLPNTTFWKYGDAKSERDIFKSHVGTDAIIRLMIYEITGAFQGQIGSKHGNDPV